MKNSITPVLVLGFDPRVLKAFEIFFSTKCNGVFFIVQESKKASIALIDFDIIHSKNKLGQIRSENPNIIIFLLSMLEKQSEIPNTYFLRKPINYLDLKKELMSVHKALINNKPFRKPVSKSAPRAVYNSYSKTQPLNKKIASQTTQMTKKAQSHSTSAAITLSQQNETDFVGNNPDIDLSNPQEILKILYSSKNRFQKVVKTTIAKARKENKPIQVICMGVGLIVDPLNNQVLTAVGDTVLRPICLLKVEQVDSFKILTHPINGDEILNLSGKIDRKLNISNLDAFIWKIALWSARGKIPNTTDLNTPIYLSEWPNFTRLQNFPHSMRIAAFLIQQPCRLGDISKQLGIPQRHVFSFYSAANALGLSHNSKRKIDSTFHAEASSKKIAPRNFLRKILGKLIGSNNTNEYRISK